MIESIEFKNFKALRDTTLPLGRFTLIVGPNGSGKSSALQSLKICADPVRSSFNRLVTAGLESKPGTEVKIEIASKLDGISSRFAARWAAINQGRGGFSYLDEGVDFHSFLDQIRHWLNRIKVYSLDAQVIAYPTTLTPYIALGEDGNHLAGVMDQLRDQDEELFERLNQALGQWIPEFDRILFETPEQGQRAFLLRTRNGHHKIPAKELSQGTLLAIAMLVIAYSPNSPPVIGLEEPDRGIHPRLLRDVQDALYRLAYPENYGEDRPPVQVIATTHSPYFLDLFRDHPEEVVLANKTDDGTKFERLSDQPNLDEILEDSHLGEVWYTGILGGVPAHA
jgi:predicted ATPase